MPDEREAVTADEMATSFHAWALSQVATVPASEVASTLGCDGAELASAGLIVLRDGDDAIVPLFQVDRDARAARPVVVAVNRLLLAETDPWGALSWWLTANPRWGDRRPINHLEDDQLEALAEASTDDGF